MIMSCVCRTSWLKMSTSASPLSQKRRECCRNTGRNEQLQLKTVPKTNGHIFHPIWDVTNCSQRAQEKGRLFILVSLYWNYMLVFWMQKRTHQMRALFLCVLILPFALIHPPRSVLKPAQHDLEISRCSKGSEKRDRLSPLEYFDPALMSQSA